MHLNKGPRDPSETSRRAKIRHLERKNKQLSTLFGNPPGSTPTKTISSHLYPPPAVARCCCTHIRQFPYLGLPKKLRVRAKKLVGEMGSTRRGCLAAAGLPTGVPAGRFPWLGLRFPWLGLRLTWAGARAAGGGLASREGCAAWKAANTAGSQATFTFLPKVGPNGAGLQAPSLQ